jgi:tol-pal system protein YbgF
MDMSVLLRATLIVGLSACAVLAQAADAPDRRAVRKAPVVVTTVSAEETAALRESVVDLLRQMEDMQVQLQQLQNQVELQTHEVAQLKVRERDLMGDLDRRLREIERAASERTAAPIAPAPATPAASMRTVSTQEQKDYDAAFKHMKQGQYQRAIKGFRGFLTQYADSPLADNAQYWIAEGHYVLRNYKVAQDEFAKIMSGYPNSPKTPDALLKIGYIHQELNNADQARKTLRDVVQRFPQSSAARLAQQRLDKMKGAAAAR